MYDVNELYKKKWLDMQEVSFLLGGLAKNNIYTKFKSGQIPYVKRKNKDIGKEVIRVRTKDLYNYILERRKKHIRDANKLLLPTIEIPTLK